MENIIDAGWTVLTHSSDSEPTSSRENRVDQMAPFSLRLAGEGELVEIVSLTGGKGVRDRLVSLGLGIGAKVEIIQNHMTGKILLGHNGSRLYLGGGMAHKIQVTIVEGGQK